MLTCSALTGLGWEMDHRIGPAQLSLFCGNRMHQAGFVSLSLPEVSPANEPMCHGWVNSLVWDFVAWSQPVSLIDELICSG